MSVAEHYRIFGVVHAYKVSNICVVSTIMINEQMYPTSVWYQEDVAHLTRDINSFFAI